jgi:hypothetical protein
MKTDFHEPKADWERELDRRLQELPDLEAPPSLIGRVHAALSTGAAVSWWQRPWWGWPVGLRAASVLLMAATTLLLGFLYVEVREAVLASYWQHAVTELRAAVDPFLQLFHALGRAAEMTLRLLCGSTCMFLAVALLGLYLLCIGVGTALFRTLRAVHVNA